MQEYQQCNADIMSLACNFINPYSGGIKLENWSEMG